jgi:hypothetical protein
VRTLVDCGKRRAIVRLLAILGGSIGQDTHSVILARCSSSGQALVCSMQLVTVIKDKIEKRLDVHPDR